MDIFRIDFAYRKPDVGFVDETQWVVCPLRSFSIAENVLLDQFPSAKISNMQWCGDAISGSAH